MEWRPYSGDADVELLADFARAATAARWPGSTYWHVGDIIWRLFQNTDAGPQQNIRLWIDDQGLAGVGWFEPPSAHSRCTRRASSRSRSASTFM